MFAESRGGQERFELQMPESEGRRFRWNEWTADMVGRGARQDLVDDIHTIEAGHDRQSAGHDGGLEVADVLAASARRVRPLLDPAWSASRCSLAHQRR
jgi:hypothetical protein